LQDKNRTAFALAIEMMLMMRGGDRYYRFVFKLRNSYNCEIIDCYDKPQYLKNVLKEIYGNQYDSIVEDIRLELSDSVNEEDIAAVLAVLEKNPDNF